MPTLKELKKETTEYLMIHEGTTSEFDMSINDISRQKADAMKKEYGKCFVGKINLYGDERKKEYKLTEYIAGERPFKDLKENECNFIYNFEYDFCIPVYDKELETMINDRDKTPYTGSKPDSDMIEAITNRIEQLKGVHLFWA